MRKVLLLAVIFGLFLSVGVKAHAQTGIQFSWNAYTVPSGWGTCSSTVKTSCVVGMKMSDVTNASSPVVVGSPAITDTSLLIALPSAGSHTYNLVASGFDFSGNAISSPPAVVTVNVPSTLPPLTAPGGLAAKVQ